MWVSTGQIEREKGRRWRQEWGLDASFLSSPTIRRKLGFLTLAYGVCALRASTDNSTPSGGKPARHGKAARGQLPLTKFNTVTPLGYLEANTTR
jgi:hypothetical protein